MSAMLRRAARTGSFLLAIGAFVGPAVSAQGPGVPAPFDRIRDGAPIRVTLNDGTRLEGRLERVGDGRLGIRLPERGVEPLPLGRVMVTEVRSTHLRTGAIAGGVTGVLFGAFVATVARAVCDAADCDDVGPYLVAVPVFGSSGAILGGAIGSFFPRWKRVHP